MGDLVSLRRVGTRPEEMSDQALVGAAAARDAVAQGALYDRFHLDVWRFLARVAGTVEADLEDLVQMTFVEVFRSAARFGGRSAVKTWIFGIAVHVAKHHARSEGRHRAAVARMAEVPTGRPARPVPSGGSVRTQRLRGPQWPQVIETHEAGAGRNRRLGGVAVIIFLGGGGVGVSPSAAA